MLQIAEVKISVGNLFNLTTLKTTFATDDFRLGLLRRGWVKSIVGIGSFGTTF
jgi:hypothetical protein